MNEKLEEIFYREYNKELDRLNKRSIRLVHYTSCEVAIKIIENASVWMRIPLSMNDFQEVEFARQCLVDAYKNDEVVRVREALDKRFPDFCKELQTWLNHWMHKLDTGSFLFCLSEHVSGEDETGRLSMWRAYGRNNGAALVISQAVLGKESEDPNNNIFLIPVKYAKKDRMEREFVKFFLEIKKFLKNPKILRDELLNAICYFLIFKIIGTKHIGFSEEKEWRLVIIPELYNSEYMKKEVHNINGVPQIVGVLDIERSLMYEGSQIRFGDLLDRIIVGPTDYPIQIRDALVEKLRDRGVAGPEQKVFLSNIPFRP